MVPGSYDGEPTIEAISRSLDFIRFGPSLHVTALIENYLASIGTVPPRVYEFNSIDAAVSMVEEGIGWTIVFPLGIMHSIALTKPGRVRCLPILGQPLDRTVRLIGHVANGFEMGRRLVEASRQTLVDRLVPRLAAIEPWLAESMKVS